VAFASGTKKGFTLGLGAGNHGGLGIMGLSSTDQSLLAKQMAPPVQPKLENTSGCGIAVLGISLSVFLGASVSAFGSSAAGATIVIVGVIATIFASHSAENRFQAETATVEATYQKELGEWEKQWVCLRCGHVFTP
jgi:hypothetical protein